MREINTAQIIAVTDEVLRLEMGNTMLDLRARFSTDPNVGRHFNFFYVVSSVLCYKQAMTDMGIARSVRSMPAEIIEHYQEHLPLTLALKASHISHSANPGSSWLLRLADYQPEKAVDIVAGLIATYTQLANDDFGPEEGSILLSNKLVTKAILADQKREMYDFLNGYLSDMEPGLTNVSPELLKLIPKPILDASRKIIEVRDSKLPKDVLKVITNPKHKQFARLKQLMLGYLYDPHNFSTEFAAMMVVCNDEDGFVKAYRELGRAATAYPQEAEFFIEIQNAILEMSQRVEPGHLRNADEATDLMREHSSLPKPVNLSELRNLINRLPISETGIGIVFLDETAMTQFKKPNTSLIRFSNASPLKFVWHMFYELDKDDQIHLIISIDVKHGKFDWNLIEDPDLPEMTEIREKLLVDLALSLAAVVAHRDWIFPEEALAKRDQSLKPEVRATSYTPQELRLGKTGGGGKSGSVKRSDEEPQVGDVEHEHNGVVKKTWKQVISPDDADFARLDPQIQSQVRKVFDGLTPEELIRVKQQISRYNANKSGYVALTDKDIGAARLRVGGCRLLLEVVEVDGRLVYVPSKFGARGDKTLYQ